MSRGDLSGAEWRLLKDLLPAERGRKSRPSGDGRQNFFVVRSFSMALSSIASASSFFSFAFSLSSAFGRRASVTSSPPYFAFYL